VSCSLLDTGIYCDEWKQKLKFYFYIFSEDFLVQVQAQVMTRDDSSGGWVPMGGGGLSNVGLRRLSRPGNNGEETPLTEYLIYGERIVDKSVSITCHVPVCLAF
jgi:hypothetical protein